MTRNEHITAGQGGLPKVSLVARDGARAEIYLQGAHVTSWIPAGDTERFFLSRRSLFQPRAAIRGGVPVIFPQFANVGPLPKHGFARAEQWELVDVSPQNADAATATLRLVSSDSTRKIWPHDFILELMVTVIGQSLEMRMRVSNTEREAFSFTGALHTYLRVNDVRETTVRGLSGDDYRDKVADGVMKTEQSDRVTIAGEVDRVYLDVDTDVDVVDAHRTTHVTMSGFTDVVVWNPGPVAGAALQDMEPDGYVEMLCVEAAIAQKPFTLATGEVWTGTQRLEAR